MLPEQHKDNLLKVSCKVVNLNILIIAFSVYTVLERAKNFTKSANLAKDIFTDVESTTLETLIFKTI